MDSIANFHLHKHSDCKYKYIEIPKEIKFNVNQTEQKNTLSFLDKIIGNIKLTLEDISVSF